VEDHAYAELCYEGERAPSLKSLAPTKVVFVHTFSKIFAPGARLGWVAADSELVEKLGLAKLGTDQCANTLTQRLVYDYGRHGYIEEQVESSIELYRRKRDRMEEAMRRHFPPATKWIHPLGGFFVWVALPEGIDTEVLLPLAIEREKTAFVAGPPFFADRSGKSFMRLSFSFVPEEKIEEAIERLARAIRTLQS
jgi:2-aminoadipate transaminase